MVFSVHVSTRCSTWHQGSDLEGWATPGCAKLALSRLAVYPNGWWSSQLHTSVIYLSTYVDTYVSYCEFHSIPLPFTSITYFHYITLYIYIYIYVYIYIHIERERVGYIWYYVIMQYMAFLSLMIIMYKTCISFFSIRAMAPPRRSNVSTPRSGRFAALRSGTTSALSSTWRHPTWRHDNMHLSLW